MKSNLMRCFVSWILIGAIGRGHRGLLMKISNLKSQIPIVVGILSLFVIAAAADDKTSVADQRIAFLREKMERIRLRSADSPQTKFPLHEKLALRWSNPVSGVVDGGVFIWTDGRRPVVIGKAFLRETGGPAETPSSWSEAIESVTSVPFVMQADGRDVWKPASPGVRYHDLGETEGQPSDNESARLTQMRGLARKIQVIGNWGQPPTDWQLRTLTTPLFRYASEPDGIVDGAVFAYTQGGTNPEAIALIEAMATEAKSKPHWRIAVTRLTSYGVRASFNDNLIAEYGHLKNAPLDATFYGRSNPFPQYPFPQAETTAKETSK